MKCLYSLIDFVNVRVPAETSATSSVKVSLVLFIVSSPDGNIHAASSVDLRHITMDNLNGVIGGFTINW